MNANLKKRLAAATLVLALGALTGCRDKDQAAVDQAESQATTTNTPQQVQWIDRDGNTITKIVQPPTVQGQKARIASDTKVAPPAGQPKPRMSDPVIMPYNGPLGPTTSVDPATTGQPLTQTAGQPLDQPAGQPMQDPNGKPMAGTPAGYVNNAPAGSAPYGGAQPASTAPYSLTVRAGTELAIRINQSISVKHTPAGAHFTGEVAAPVVRDGNVIIPRGTPVRGRVDASHRRGHFKGSSILELRLTSMTLNGSEYALDTHDNVHTKKGKGKRTAGWIGGLTGAGMVIGGIASGGVGLAIGGAAGAGAGTLIAGTTGNRDIDIPAESIQHFRLADDLVVQAP